MIKWIYINKQLPTNEQIVFIRLANGNALPFKCQYDSTAQTFTDTTTSAIFALIDVLRWSENYPV